MTSNTKWQLSYLCHNRYKWHDQEGLHKGYDRFQTLLSQLEIHCAGVSHKDTNQKFLRSLPSSWSQVALIMWTKLGLDTLSFNDLYNNLRVFEHDVKATTASSSSNTHNVAFVSADNTNSINDVSTAYSVSSSFVSKSQKEGSPSYTDEVIHSFFPNQSSSPQLDCHDLEQIDDDDDMEEMDLKCRRRNARYNGNKARDTGGRPTYQDDSKALVTNDGEDIDWSGHVEEDTQNFAMMAYSSSNSGSDNEILSEYDTIQAAKFLLLGIKLTLQIIKNLRVALFPLEVAMEGTGKGKIKSRRLDFEDVYYVEELKHYNLFSVSQICDKKNKVLFTDTDCLVLSPDFVLPDENQGNLVKGLPSKIFENDHTCVACQKGKQHKASCKAKTVSSVNQPLQILHMDLFGPTSVRSINHKTYCLVITDGFIRSDNKIEFKDHELIEFCGSKGIKREYSNARTSQQNGVAERKNMTLIKAARPMLADSFLPTTFWAEAVNTACYVLNRVLVTKLENKKPYELLTGRQPIISYLRPFRCHVTILNTIDQQGKFDRKSDSGFLVRYSLNSKAFRVYNLETNGVEENLHANFLEIKPNVAGKGHAWMFDLDYLINSINYEPVLIKNQANKSAGPKEANNSAGTQVINDQGVNSKEIDLIEEHFVLHIWSAYSTTIKSSGDKIEKNVKPISQVEQIFKEELEKLKRQEKEANDALRKEATHDSLDANTNSTNLLNAVSALVSVVGPSRALNDAEPSYPDDPSMPHLEDIFASPSEGIFTNSSYDDEDLPFRKKAIGTKWVYRNKKDKRRVIVRNKARLVAQGHRQEEMIEYDEVFARVARIEAIRIFLSFASYMGFIVYQMDVKSAFLYGTINEEVYVTQPPGFVDPKFPNKVYVDDIIFGSTKKSWCDEFEELMKNRFQMSSMGELTFFLGLQVKQKEDGIFISQDKYVAKILKKFDFFSVKTASTPTETQKPLVKDEEAANVDVHLYRYLKGQPKLGLWYPKVSSFNLEAYSYSDYAGADLDRKSTTKATLLKGRLLEVTTAKHSNEELAIPEKTTAGVNTPRCDEDSLELKELMVFFVLICVEKDRVGVTAAKPAESEGFEQIIDFLNRSSVRYALIACPTIHTSCIKQFWSTAKVKTVNDEVRVQALIDEKRINIKESSILRTLKLDDEEGTSCLANDEIFTGLANMGYEKISDKLSFYKAFFSPQWKFLIHIILQCLSAKTTSWNEFSGTMALASICLATNQKFNFSRYILLSFVKNIEAGVPFYMFLRVLTPLFENMLVPAAEEVGQAQDDVSILSEPSTSIPHKKHKSKTHQPISHMVPSPKPSPEHQLLLPSNDPIPTTKDNKNRKLKDRIHKLEEENRILKEKSFKPAKIDTAAPVEDNEESFKQGRMIAYIDEDVKDIDEEEPAKMEEVLKVVTAAKLITEVGTTAKPTITAAQVPKGSAPRRRRGVVIQDLEEIATLVINDVIEQVNKSERQNNAMIRYQALKRKPLTKAQARKNMMIYLKNMDGFKMKFFKGMTYGEIRPLFEKHYNLTQAFLEKVEEEKQRMDEEAKELQRHLQIMANDDDDVYIEDTSLASKVPVVDYQIHHENSKPYYKIIRVDGSYKLFLSFITLLKNFDREVLETLWKLVKERYGLAKVKNWKLFESCGVHIITFTTTWMFLLVKKKYPLTHFTLEQMLNNAKLEVEEESEMSLELLRLVRRQLNEGYVPE
nr:hypothetical protein [Tanacetum cinerariifolium]